MFETQLDAARNRLIIQYKGRVSPEELTRCNEEVAQHLTKLQSGFSLLTDLTDLDSMDVACVPQIRAMMDRCNKRGVKTVVRSVPDPHKDIGLNILSLFHYGRGVHIVTCATMQEALQALNTE